MANELKIEQWPIERLIPYCRNPRKNDSVVDKMVSAIKEFGFRIPIVAKSDGSVVDGHLRLKAAKKLGLKEVPVALADELTDAQVKAFRLLANKSANWAEWDEELLRLELKELEELDFNLELTGFDKTELDSFTNVNDVLIGNKYSEKIATPIYEPTGVHVSLEDCIDLQKYNKLLERIDKSEISVSEKDFLRHAASRHVSFNYQKIAEYYANKASAEMQELMENSCLVIIDVDNAIENGFVKLTEHVADIMNIHNAS